MASRRTIVLVVALVATAAAPFHPREEALEAEIAARADPLGVELRSDPALRDAARELAVVYASGANIDPHEFLRQAESAHGVLDPFPYVLVGTATEAKLGDLRDGLLKAMAAQSVEERRLYTHVAVGLAPEPNRGPFHFGAPRFHAVFLLSQRAITFAPLPDEAHPGDRFLLEGEIHAPFREPEVFVTWPSGEADELDNLALEPGRFRAWIRFEKRGEYQIEILGRNDMGPRVLGLGSVFVDNGNAPRPYAQVLAAARSGTLEIHPPVAPAARAATTPEDAETHLLELVNRDRRQAGLPELQADETLARMARAHSLDMSEHGFFAHVSPRTGRLLERATSAGLRFARLGENIAVHRDVDEAEAALLRSPGHRKNILDPQFTRVGIGVAFHTSASGEPQVYVTQNFMLPAP